MRWPLGLIIFALAAASCGGNAIEPTSTASTPASTTTIVQTETTTTTAEAVGPAAPGFDLELADGSTFTLSAAEKPVYMVFWAEW